MSYAALILTVVLAAVCVAVWRRARARTAAVEAGDGPTAEKVHALRRLGLQVTGTAFAVIMANAGALALAAAGAPRHRHTPAQVAALVGAVVVYLLAAGLLLLLGTRVVRPALARIRDVPARPAGRRRALLVVLPASLVTGALVAGALALLPHDGAGRLVGLAAVYLVVIVGLQSLLAPLVTVALRTHPLDDATHDRLLALAARMGVRVRDVRAVEGREQKSANAVQVGTIPRLRYVLVSDYLLDHLDDDEVDAVVAHEFGHVRGRHVLLRLAVCGLVWAVLEALVVGVRGHDTHGAAALAALPLLVALPLGLLLVNGLLGVRLERRADDAACRATSAAALAGALDRVAELNHAKRDTGRGWAILTQHPGTDERIARLRGDPRAARPPSAQPAT